MTMIISCSCFSSLPSNYLNNSQKDFPFLNKLYSCKSIKEVKQIHGLIIKTIPTPETQQSLCAKIISLCASFPHFVDLSYIHTLFTQLLDPDIYLYNDVMKCFSGAKSRKDAVFSLILFRELLETGLAGNGYTYPVVLKACAQLGARREGEMVHAQVVKNGFLFDLYVLNTLMRFYCVCGRIWDARKVFDGSPEQDVISWTTLIQGYVDNALWKAGLEMYFDMCRMGFMPDEKTLAVVISACAKWGDLNTGRKLHECILNQKLNVDVYVWNSLVDLYLKCGDVESAFEVFSQIPVSNVVSWNSMISGLVQCGEYKKALSVFWKMQQREIEVDEITLIGVLNSCAHLGIIELGMWVHAYVKRRQISLDGFVGNALFDMYAKCGSIKDALGVFKDIKFRDVYTYSTLILGLAMHGKGEMALQLFLEMVAMGVVPNEVTFTGVLTACCHAGLVEEGYRHFREMSRLYNINPKIQHYGAIVDLLSRAGLISEAHAFVKNMPIEPDAAIWGSLLGACRVHGNLMLAESVMKKLVELETNKDGPHILMSNIYASQKRWNDSFRIRKGMRKGKIKKTPGCSSIELDGVVHEFRKGDKTHSKIKEIHMLIDTMKCHLNDTENLMEISAHLL